MLLLNEVPYFDNSGVTDGKPIYVVTKSDVNECMVISHELTRFI